MAVPLMPDKPWYERDLDDQVVVQMSSTQKDALREHADTNQISLSQMIRFACNYWLERVEAMNDDD